MNRRRFLSAAGGAVFGGPALWGQNCNTAQAEWNTKPQTQALSADRRIEPPNQIRAMPPADIDCRVPVRAGQLPNLKQCVAFEPKKCDPLPRRLWSRIDANKDQSFLEDLSRGYRCLEALGPNDNRSLIRQAWLHDFYCSGSWNGADVHRTWAFLPWHRAFIYFHERILARVLNKPEFRLPVWDWENNRHVPDFFDKLGLPTFLTGVVGHKKYDSEHNVVAPPLVQAWFSSQSFEDFCGRASCPPDGCPAEPSQPGTPPNCCLSQAAGSIHTDVHVNLVGGAMSETPTAAGDPIFYGHHANVDRFWWYWLKSYSFPIPDDFKNQSFYFYDEDRQLVRVEAWQILDEGSLGYRYDDEPGVRLPKLRPLSVGQAALSDWAALQLEMRTLTVGELLSTGQSVLAVVNSLRDPQMDFQKFAGFAAGLTEFPVQIMASLETKYLNAGEYYGVMLSNPDGTYPIAGCSIFASQDHLKMHASMDVVMAGSLSPALFRALLHSGGGFQLVYGKLEEGRDRPTHTRPIPNPQFKILYPEDVYQKGQAFLNSFGPF